MRRLAAVAALLLTVALLAATGFMVGQQRRAQAEEHARAEFAAAARQAVISLMSIDHADPEDSVRRIVDNSTDPFRAEFQSATDDFIKVSRDAKVTTTVTADAAAVRSMTGDSAVVLVAASSTVTPADGTAEPPRSWRLSVDLRRDGDQIKMSNVEFVG